MPTTSVAQQDYGRWVDRGGWQPQEARHDVCRPDKTKGLLNDTAISHAAFEPFNGFGHETI